MSSPALIRDFQHEQRIKRIGRACSSAHAAGDHDAAVIHWDQLRQAIAERSPEQIQRMEAKLGLRVRRQIKSALMVAFCHGWIPAAAVTTAFQLFQLHGV
ncbi:hypothetical protein [Dyella sp. 2HG41-7]|uniref:hypothetical protein n=1 Tax=Dyella sp. 2HG41-7 TaxID=2883239 RepID=UPI001F45A411|nr:hypothetical protein [Dyella sp. 2HG41-7]